MLFSDEDDKQKKNKTIASDIDILDRCNAIIESIGARYPSHGNRIYSSSD